jgi:hypothetical protein
VIKPKVINNKFTFTCKHCEYNKIIPIVNNLTSQEIVCGFCKKTSIVEVCFRKEHRKDCSIYGEILLNKIKKIPVIIKNISFSGYKLESLNKTIIIPINEIILISYELPKRNNEIVEIKEEIKIVNIVNKNKNNIVLYGTSVLNQIDYSYISKQKGFWLMNVKEEYENLSI